MKKRIRNSATSVLVIILFLCSCGSDSTHIEDEKRKSISEHEAKAVAEWQVETLLKSPSTAKYSGLRDTKIAPVENGFKVEGYVDSQNGFGAEIRSNYSIEVYLDTLSGDIMYRALVLE